MISPGARVVFRKEVTDNLRDRRTLAAALLYPLLGPAMIVLMIVSIGQLTKESEKPLKLPVASRKTRRTSSPFSSSTTSRSRKLPKTRNAPSEWASSTSC